MCSKVKINFYSQNEVKKAKFEKYHRSYVKTYIYCAKRNLSIARINLQRVYTPSFNEITE